MPEWSWFALSLTISGGTFIVAFWFFFMAHDVLFGNAYPPLTTGDFIMVASTGALSLLGLFASCWAWSVTYAQ